MKIVIAGGGTAGHIYPGISIADELVLEIEDAEIIFIGNKDGIEERIVKDAGYEFEPIKVKGFKRSFSIENINAVTRSLRAFSEVKQFLKKFKPEVVVGMGGYVSAPAIAAAYNSKIPTLIHEQNAYPGFANKLLSRFVDTVATSFPNGEECFTRAKRVVFTGNPIRRRMIGAVKDTSLDNFNLEKGKKTLLIFGGSQGAKKINDSVINSYKMFKNESNLQIIHITGKDHFSEVCKEMKKIVDTKKDKLRYQAHPYINDINRAYAAADICLCRAGATTIAEITALGVPAILVPYPHATGSHQKKNADFLVNHGAAKKINDEDLTPDSFYKASMELISDNKTMVEMKNHSQKIGKPFAANDIAKLINGISHKLKI